MSAVALALACAVAAEEPPALPDALPPIDDAVVAAPASPITFFGQLRIRGELDDARDFARNRLTAAGVALTGRVGVDAEIEGARLDVVVGDGGRVGPPAVAPTLVVPPPIAALWQTSLTLPFSLAGQAAAVDVGRMPVVVADGRLVGTEPFDPRGRTLDGASVRVHAGPAFVALGGFLLDDVVNSPAADSASGVVVLSANERLKERTSATDVDLYALLHRDGPDGLTLPTAGARLAFALPPPIGFGEEAVWRAGADVQTAVADRGPAGTAPGFVDVGNAGHAEAGVHVLLPPFMSPTPFVDASAEVTAGRDVAGRVFRAPAPTQHDALGLLDLVAWDNTWSAAVAAGIDPRDAMVPDERTGLALSVRGRVVGTVDPGGPLLDTAFQPLAIRHGSGVAFFEIDAGIELPISNDISLGVAYGVALPGTALIGNEPAQRLLVSLRASALPFATSGVRDRSVPALP